MTEDFAQLLRDAAARARQLPPPMCDVMWWYFAAARPTTPDGQHVQIERAVQILAMPAPVVDRNGLLAALKDAADDWDAMQNSVTAETWEGTRDEWIADALIAAGQVRPRGTRSAREIRRALTDQEGDTDG